MGSFNGFSGTEFLGFAESFHIVDLIFEVHETTRELMNGMFAYLFFWGGRVPEAHPSIDQKIRTISDEPEP